MEVLHEVLAGGLPLTTTPVADHPEEALIINSGTGGAGNPRRTQGRPPL